MVDLKQSRFSMSEIEPTAAEIANPVDNHNGLWVLLASVAFILFAGGALLSLRWFGLK
jgi:hypothetical protein